MLFTPEVLELVDQKALVNQIVGRVHTRLGRVNHGDADTILLNEIRQGWEKLSETRQREFRESKAQIGSPEWFKDKFSRLEYQNLLALVPATSLAELAAVDSNESSTDTLSQLMLQVESKFFEMSPAERVNWAESAQLLHKYTTFPTSVRDTGPAQLGPVPVLQFACTVREWQSVTKSVANSEDDEAESALLDKREDIKFVRRIDKRTMDANVPFWILPREHVRSISVSTCSFLQHLWADSDCMCLGLGAAQQSRCLRSKYHNCVAS